MHSISLKRSIVAILVSGITCQSMAAPNPDQPYPSTDQRRADDPCAKNNAQAAGAMLGAVLGGLLGNQIGKGNGKKWATAVGALGGLALGNYIGSELDRRKCELSKIAKNNNLDVVMSDLTVPQEPDGNSHPRADSVNARVGISMSIADQPSGDGASDVAGGDAIGNAALSTQFQSGSDVLSNRAEGYFREIAAQYAMPFRADALAPNASQDHVNALQGLRQKRLLILGHTDDTGNSRLNADLSEHRARNVARLFGEAGVPVSQIYYQGSGETQPVADNRSAEGRSKNRRVEIVDLSDEATFQKYLASRSTNPNFYRVTAATAIAQSSAPDEEPARPPRPVKAAPLAPPASAGARQPARIAARAEPAPAAAQAAVRHAPSASRTGAAAAPALAGYDFGGAPAGTQATAIDIGKLVTPARSFNFISPAVADDLPMAHSCGDDRPRVANAVKALQTNQEYRVGEYLPNLYDTSWADRVNGNLVALTHVAVLRDGAAPARKPTVMIFKASRGKPAADARPDYSAVADVNTYQGETGLLYRVFVNGPIKCIDLVIPRDRPAMATNSNLYYQVGATRMMAAFNPKIAK